MRARKTVSRFALAGVLSVLLASSAQAETVSPAAPTVLRSGTAHEMLFDVAFEGGHGVAVGAYGAILTTTNDGREWMPASTKGFAEALLGTSIAGGRCLAVGQGGALMVADDCRNWRSVASPTRSRLMAVSMNRHGLAYAVGAFGTVLRATDGGRNWAAVSLDWGQLNPEGFEPHLYDVHVAADGSVTLVGESGLILSSADGAQWQVRHHGGASLFGLAMVGSQAYAVGQAGRVLVSTDGGERWTPRKSGTTALLTGVWADGKGRVVASGVNALMESKDSGRRWLSVGDEPHASLVAVAAGQVADGSLRVVAVGTSATVLELPR